MNSPADERRKYLRIYRNFILSYHEKGKPIIKHNLSQVNNLSKGGMSFSSTRPLADGAVVVVDLKTLFIADSINLEGIVLECREKVPGMIFEIRIEFQNVPAQVLLVLEKIENYAKAKED